MYSITLESGEQIALVFTRNGLRIIHWREEMAPSGKTKIIPIRASEPFHFIHQYLSEQLEELNGQLQLNTVVSDEIKAAFHID